MVPFNSGQLFEDGYLRRELELVEIESDLQSPLGVVELLLEGAKLLGMLLPLQKPTMNESAA